MNTNLEQGKIILLPGLLTYNNNKISISVVMIVWYAVLVSYFISFFFLSLTEESVKQEIVVKQEIKQERPDDKSTTKPPLEKKPKLMRWHLIYSNGRHVDSKVWLTGQH